VNATSSSMREILLGLERPSERVHGKVCNSERLTGKAGN
jgi:hypothetical protein